MASKIQQQSSWLTTCENTELSWIKSLRRESGRGCKILSGHGQDGIIKGDWEPRTLGPTYRKCTLVWGEGVVIEKLPIPSTAFSS